MPQAGMDQLCGKLNDPQTERSVGDEPTAPDRNGNATEGEGRGRLEGHASIENDVFVWREGRAEVRVAREGGFWNVEHTSTGRLLGPRLTLYSERHKDPKHAAWDVMARVIRESSDEDKGLRVARSAVQWMRETLPLADTDD